jgi:hypothetical protein
MGSTENMQISQIVHDYYSRFAGNLQPLFDAMSNVDSQLYACGFELPYSNLKMLPVEQTPGEKVYSPGTQYALYSNLLEILGKARTDILVIDAYPDENLLNLYLSKISAGVKIRVLTSNMKSGTETTRTNFITVAKKFSKMPGINFEAKENNQVHDRFIFVDGQCWVMGSSIKDAAVIKPTYILKVESGSLFQSIFEEMWNSGKSII